MITMDGKQYPWYPGMDVEQLLANVDKPEQYAVIRLNGKPVSRPNFKDTPVPDPAEVVLIPMVAGGKQARRLPFGIDPGGPLEPP